MKRILASSFVLAVDVAWNVTGTAASKFAPLVNAIYSVPVKQKHVNRFVPATETSAPSKSFKTRVVHTAEESSEGKHYTQDSQVFSLPGQRAIITNPLVHTVILPCITSNKIT